MDRVKDYRSLNRRLVVEGDAGLRIDDGTIGEVGFWLNRIADITATCTALIGWG